MNHKHKKYSAFNDEPTNALLTKPHLKLDGSGKPEKRNRPVHSFPKKKENHNFLSLWKGIGQQINDNVMEHPPKRKYFVRAASLSLLLATVFVLNSSAVATHLVLHANDSVLATAMEVNPEALAYVLNNMDVGE